MPRTSLPSNVESLKKLLHAAEEQLQSLSAQLRSRDVLIEKMRLELAHLKRMRFGRSSEQLDEKIAQLEFSLEELEAKEAAIPALPASVPEVEVRVPRKPLPTHLPRESLVHEPAGGICQCTECGGKLHRLGDDVSEMLEYVPSHWKVLKHVRTKYSCGQCQKIVQAAAPSRPIERSFAGPGLLAHIAVSKYCDHLPLYRQSQIYARDGIELERATMAEWIGAAQALLEPLHEALGRYVLSTEKLHADDTPIPVLAPGTGKTKTGRLWTYVRDDRPSGSHDPPAVLFRYSPDRKGERPRQHLKSFRGILQADGYAGFNGLYDRAAEPLKEAACWAHARRKFFDLHAATDSPMAREALERIALLYQIEADIRGQLPEVRRAAREQRAALVLAELYDWLRAKVRETSKKSELARAIGYTLSRWQALTRYCHDGRIEIDNNAAERALRAVASGAKIFSLPVPMPAVSAPPLSTVSSVPQNLTAWTRKRTCARFCEASLIIRSTASTNCCLGILRKISRNTPGNPHALRNNFKTQYGAHLTLTQEAIFGRAGLAIPRSTLAQWVGACGVQLQPLVDAMRTQLLTRAVLHADETPVPMLKPGLGRTHRAYLWSYSTSEYDPAAYFAQGRPPFHGKTVHGFTPWRA